MNFPEDLKHVKSHEWVKTLEDGTILMGISDYTQDALGDLIFVDLPETGDEAAEGKSFIDVRSVKAVSNVYSPVSGMTAEINEALPDALESINEVPYKAWLMKMKNVAGTAQLISVTEYEKYAKTLD